MGRKKSKQTTVTATLPGEVDLSKLKSGNSLEIKIRRGEDLLGTLRMGKGSVEWWPKGNKTNSLHKRWRAFAAMLEKYMK